MEVDSGEAPKTAAPKEKFGEFGSMNTVIDQLTSQIERQQQKHAERVKRHEKQRTAKENAQDMEKQRLL